MFFAAIVNGIVSLFLNWYNLFFPNPEFFWCLEHRPSGPAVLHHWMMRVSSESSSGPTLMQPLRYWQPASHSYWSKEWWSDQAWTNHSRPVIFSQKIEAESVGFSVSWSCYFTCFSSWWFKDINPEHIVPRVSGQLHRIRRWWSANKDFSFLLEFEW